jgi:hypothetical protein
MEGVVAVLRPREPIHPRTRPITCNTVQVHSNHLVHHLGLPIHLWVKRRAHAELNARQAKQVAAAGEDGVPITHDGQGKPVQLNDAVEERPGH